MHTPDHRDRRVWNNLPPIELNTQDNQFNESDIALMNQYFRRF